MPENTISSEGPLVVGGGPVGMLTALRLAQLGVPCTLCEMHTETTCWPKMDNNSPHTMEILRIMGLVEEYRQQSGAVAQDSDWDTLFFNTCGPGKKLVGRWHIPSNNDYRAHIYANNNGSQPAEPGQRCSQIVLEAFLKQKCLASPFITCHFGYRFLSLIEDDAGITASFVDLNDQYRTFRASYLVGADGAQSKVRNSVGIKMQGTQLPSGFFMVHFKSKHLTKLSPFGRWWHAFGLHGGFIIDQDGCDTYTCHEPCSLDDVEVLAEYQQHPEKVPYRVLGSLAKPYQFEIDEILLANPWRPNFAIADSYVSRDGGGRVLLAGDSAHRNPPHGGYGMNSGMEDAFSVSWRLAALHKGIGGQYLITSYTHERRHNMMMRLERCTAHIGKFTPIIAYAMSSTKMGILLQETVDGDKARSQITTHLDNVGSENIDRGVELDLRYMHSEIIVSDGTREPDFNVSSYTPSTRPGHRAPHVFLNDNRRSTLDLYGTEWTLMDFSKIEHQNQTMDSKTYGIMSPATMFATVAKTAAIPLKHVQLDADENHVKSVWEDYNYVLLRPDGYVAWRGGKMGFKDDGCELNVERISEILKIALGLKADPSFVMEQRKELRLNFDFPSIHGTEECLKTH